MRGERTETYRGWGFRCRVAGDCGGRDGGVIVAALPVAGLLCRVAAAPCGRIRPRCRASPPAVLRGAPGFGWRRGGMAFPPPPARGNPDGSRPAIRIRRAAEARSAGDPPARVIGWRLARWRVRSRCRRWAGGAAGRRKSDLPTPGRVRLTIRRSWRSQAHLR